MCSRADSSHPEPGTIPVKGLVHDQQGCSLWQWQGGFGARWEQQWERGQVSSALPQGLALSGSIERSCQSSRASKLVHLKQLNDTSLVLLPYFFLN